MNSIGLFLGSCFVSGKMKAFLGDIIDGNPEHVQKAIENDPCLLDGKWFYWRFSTLHIAVSRGNVEILTVLVEQGADINAGDIYGRTPLMTACRKARWNCVQRLLDHGANVFIASSYLKFTCLHYAAKAGHAESIKKILSAADALSTNENRGMKRFVNGRNKYGVSALHLAARNGHFAATRILLEYGALVSTTTDTFVIEQGHGSTPLHFAARCGSLACVQELLAWGADRHPRDYAGFTAYDIALRHGNFSCAALLDLNSPEPIVWPSPLKFMRELDAATKNLLESALLESNRELNATVRATVGNRRGGTNNRRINFLKSSGTRTTLNEEIPETSGFTTCDICFEQLCTIQLKQCGHEMCAMCTLKLCCHSKPKPGARFTPPPACPFCRRGICSLILAPCQQKRVEPEACGYGDPGESEG